MTEAANCQKTTFRLRITIAEGADFQRVTYRLRRTGGTPQHAKRPRLTRGLFPYLATTYSPRILQSKYHQPWRS